MKTEQRKLKALRTLNVRQQESQSPLELNHPKEPKKLRTLRDLSGCMQMQGMHSSMLEIYRIA